MPDTPEVPASPAAENDFSAIPVIASGPIAEPPAPPSPFSARNVFLGADGLRAGWSLLIFAVLLAALLAATTFLFSKIYPHPPAAAHPATQTGKPPAAPVAKGAPIKPRPMLLNEGLAFFCVALATWIMAKIERRPNSVYGFSPRRWLPNFAAGLVWGLVFLSLLVLTLRATGLLVFDARLLFGAAALHYGAIWLVGFLLVGLLEEYLTRGYLQFTLTRGLSGIYAWLFKTPHANALGFWTAAVILSFLFGFGHRSNPGESPLGLLSAGLAGFFFCFSLWRTGSLWWAVGFHCTWDWAQSFLYGVADSGLMVQGHLFGTHPLGRPFLSGGLTGPEGSLFLYPVLALAVAILVLTLPANSGPERLVQS